MEWAGYSAAGLLGFFLGSIPTGFLVARARGIDIRKVGSGNIGATNAFRILGKPAGVFVLVVDGMKGWLACAWAGPWVFRALSGWWSAEARDYVAIIAGVAAVLGHNYTPWLQFRGGKGIATSAGVLAALVPAAFIAIFVVWTAVFLIGRYVSLASIAAALALPLATWCSGYSQRLILVTSAMTLLAVYKHKSNIQRLLNGTENRIHFKRIQ